MDFQFFLPRPWTSPPFFFHISSPTTWLLPLTKVIFWFRFHFCSDFFQSSVVIPCCSTLFKSCKLLSASWPCPNDANGYSLAFWVLRLGSKITPWPKGSALATHIHAKPIFRYSRISAFRRPWGYVIYCRLGTTIEFFTHPHPMDVSTHISIVLFDSDVLNAASRNPFTASTLLAPGALCQMDIDSSTAIRELCYHPPTIMYQGNIKILRPLLSRYWSLLLPSTNRYVQDDQLPFPKSFLSPPKGPKTPPE